MTELHEVVVPISSAAGKTRIDNVYRGGAGYPYFGGALEKIVIDVTTGSGFVNGGSLWIAISGTGEKLLDTTGHSGTTTKIYYPRRIIENISGTAITIDKGNNLFERFVLGKNDVVYVGGSALATSGAGIAAGQVEANVSVFWHKF